MEFCKNCESPLSGNYCQNCGQATNIKRINSSYLLSQTLSVFNTDKGLFYTIKRLFTKPGEAIKEYLNGKRVLYSQPFVFVFLLSTIYTVLSYWLNARITTDEALILFENEQNISELHSETLLFNKQLEDVIYTYFGYISLLTMPLYALVTYIVFKGSNYNYAEHCIINTYTIAAQIIISLLLLPAKYIASLEGFLLLTLIVPALFTIRVYMQTFACTSKLKQFFKSLLAVILSNLLLFIVLFLIVFVVLYVSLL